MHRIFSLRSVALALCLVATAGVARARAQEVVAQPNPEADRLASEIRLLAADPRNVASLLLAGELSMRLGDTSAALAFFARAEAVDPANPRILAGRAATLVRLERPGEALRLFQLAEARGVPMGDYAADRGLAYDLLGAPQLAQREYQAALARGRDDETVRRHALSLGITGDVEAAMRELDPLLRRSDRAAWRARAFVMAMNGDVPGAERIAASMMPGNMGLALTPFFRRLPGLSPADRAFAVHFGELRPTAARLADAQQAPPLPGYVPESRPPVQVAVARPAPLPPVQEEDARDRRPRRDREERPVTIAEVPRPAPAPAPTPTPAPLPSPPVFTPPRPAAIVQPVPAPARVEVAQPTPAPAPAQLASNEAPAAVGGPGPAPAPAEVAVVDLPPRAAPVETRPEPSPPGPARVGQEDSVLAAIISGITIPASELEAVNIAPDVVEPAPEPVRVAAVAPVEARPKPAARPPAKKPEPAKPKAKPEPSRAWVQVAGGANEKTLPLTWRNLAKKAPAAFKGRTAWTTPLRATNRLLAGPFKSAGEAQGFVNLLGKSGISAFVFTSEAGQKITRLDVK